MIRRRENRGLRSPHRPPSGHKHHKQKVFYSLTERGIELLPVLAHMAGWGHKYFPVTEEYGIGAKLLEEGGAKMWDKFMSELRVLHLGAAPRRKSRSGTASVAARLRDAKAAAVARGTAMHKGRRRAVESRVAKRTWNGQKSKSGK
jgi:HxlR-like helix-turn-helix